MQKDMVFLAEKGITDTQANRVADYAKLAYSEIEEELDGISFVNSSVETIEGENVKYLSYGKTNVDDVNDKIRRIGELKSLCAWLREAVSAHQSVITETNRISFVEWIEQNPDKAESLPTLPKPVKPLTENDVLETFDIKKRNRYLELEAMAATYGKYVHKSGSIDSARKTMYNKINNPRYCSGSGRDMVIYTYCPSIGNEKVESLFYQLQQEQARYQSELNSIKSEIASRINNDLIDQEKRYQEEYSRYSTVNEMLRNEYNSWLAEEKKRVFSLKIVIPNSLTGIYEEIANKGKIK